MNERDLRPVGKGGLEAKSCTLSIFIVKRAQQLVIQRSGTLTLVPPALTFSQVHTVLNSGNLGAFDLRLGNLVFAWPRAFLDQVSCCTIGNVGLRHQRCLLTQLLRKSKHTALRLRIRCLDRLWSNICIEAVRSMIEARRGGGEVSLCAAKSSPIARLVMLAGLSEAQSHF